MGWEILLETYTSMGHPMREHNVFFSELEWRELMKNLPAINARISEIQLQRRQNTNKKTHMSMVQWKFNKSGQGDTPTCEHWYYRKCDARIAASIHVRDCNDIEKELAARGLEFTRVESECGTSRFHEGCLLQSDRTHSELCPKASVQGMCYRLSHC